MKRSQGDDVRQKTKTWIKGGQIIDGTGKPAFKADVLLAEERIDKVGDLGPADIEAAEVLDATGKFVMPGLIDSHCHISFDEPRTNDELFFHRRYGLAALVASVNAQKVLRAGVTAFFDADCIFDVGVDLRDAVEAGVVEGPRMTTGGNVLINCVGGTASRLLPDRGRLGYGMIVHTRDEVITEIHKQIKAGVDWIKVHVSGLPVRPGASSGEIQTWSLDELKLVCDTAHQLGVPVVGHCRNASSVRDAARAGFDMILHATYMDEDALTAVVDRKVPLVPTFTFQANLADYGSTIGADPQLQAVFKEEITASADQLKQAHQAGVPILTGSESGFSLTPYGDWHYRELNLLQTYLGLTPLEAIRAGTEFGAIALRKEGELGALKAGYLADLLILADDPLKDLDQLGRRNFIDTVIKAGRVVDRSLPLPSTWQIPGWRMSAFSDDILTRSLAETHLGPL